ncbi:MAG: deoxyguanosinetriphosphate triphosphohydrolase [Dehalococcoidales bacterium]|nr:deoxyguanosinetriphosphate triphosphohydrolase [Dehalococcoidales bacterium]
MVKRLNIDQLNIRRKSEAREEGLSPFAVKSRLSQGRVVPEEPCPIRTAFQRDRDRIIHTKAFRRLKHKTQVFIAPLGDHYVTRLTHTLEVSQIARTIARALNLNEDLVEAATLGHDLGHTPFGHAGEEVLNELYHRGFHHNLQSLRIVDVLENDGIGLNLTWEVRDGIVNHSKSGLTSLQQDWGKVGTVEGEVCRIADVVAYINHDIGDAVRAGVINEGDLPADAVDVLGGSNSSRINAMVCDIIENSWERPAIAMSPYILAATDTLRKFLFQRVYHLARKDAETGREVVCRLYEYFKANQDKLPREYLLHSEEAEQGVVDYIAGMTDQFALRLAGELKPFFIARST